MPYITQPEREHLDPAIEPLETHFLDNADSGQLNYVITKLMMAFYRGRARYKTIALVFGVLVTAGLEFYRRVVVGYEDLKKEQNGDVYETQSRRL